jgi:hypothetical protein
MATIPGDGSTPVADPEVTIRAARRTAAPGPHPMSSTAAVGLSAAKEIRRLFDRGLAHMIE